MVARSPSEAELIQQCPQGSSAAFRDLYRRYERQVQATLAQLCGADGWDDLGQEVFVRDWKRFPKFRQSCV